MKRDYALYFAWIISLSGLALSFYFGEVLQLEPCRLCWYQRMAIFPLALFLGIALYKNEPKLALYSWPFVIFGGVFALYQTLILYLPTLKIESLCGHTACSPVFAFGGVLSFPLLSLIGFVSIGFFLWLTNKS